MCIIFLVVQVALDMRFSEMKLAADIILQEMSLLSYLYLTYNYYTSARQ